VTPSLSPSLVGDEDDGGGCGLVDVKCKVSEGVTSFFRTLVDGALKPSMRLMHDTVWGTPDVSAHPPVREVWSISRGIAVALFVLLVTIAGLTLMGYETVQSRYAVKDALPRVIAGFVGANLSLQLVDVAIGFANALSGAFYGQRLDQREVSTGLFRVNLLTSQSSTLAILLGLVVVVLALYVTVVGVLRLGLVVVLTVGAPLCLAGLALPATEGLARVWCRALCAALAIQVAQALVLATATRMFYDGVGSPSLGVPGGPLMDLLVVIALLWVLVKIPSWVGRGLLMRAGTGGIGRVVKYLVISRAIGAVAGPAGLAAAGVAGRGARAARSAAPSAAATSGEFAPPNVWSPSTRPTFPTAPPMPRGAPAARPSTDGGVSSLDRWRNPRQRWQVPS
jgi:hypothetical protein